MGFGIGARSILFWSCFAYVSCFIVWFSSSASCLKNYPILRLCASKHFREQTLGFFGVCVLSKFCGAVSPRFFALLYAFVLPKAV